nr:reverse transcriptase domain-containing protein [Tanacetum cinerariifolium]
MPFDLKNAGATYQRLVDKAFDSQIGHNIEVYVDDLVVKSHTEAEMLRDIGETFCTLRRINMKLNLKKCTFRAVEGVFLAYVVTPGGIKLCPDKPATLLQLPSPRTIKEVQSLNGKLAKAKKVFKKLKQHLSELPLLVAPKPKEELIVYLSACFKVISAVLMTERRAIKMLVSFVSRALQILELNYTPMEKLVLSLIFTAMRLRRSGARLILTSPEGTKFTYALRFQFAASNNEAEYEALIVGLRITAQIGVQNVHVSVDSKLVANQVLGTYVAKEENMIKYLQKSQKLVSGGQSHTARILFPMMHRDARDMIRACKDCQIHRSVTRYPQQPLTPITAPWSFYKWGIDIAGPFPEEPGKVKFLIVVMDYFTKWIEAKSVATITGSQVKKLMWDNIMCRFGLSREIVSDNGKQFKIRMPTYRIAVVDVICNDEELQLNLDLLEGRRECATIRESKAKLKMPKYYNARVRGVTFRPGDFVYHRNDASYVVEGKKLGPKWEGPYEEIEALGDGAYKLWSTDGTVLPRT